MALAGFLALFSFGLITGAILVRYHARHRSLMREVPLRRGERRLITATFDERAALEALGNELGIDLVMAGFSPQLVGELEGHQVVVGYSKWGDGQRVVETEVRVEVESKGIPRGLELARRGTRSAKIILEAGSPEISLDDADFASTIVLSGHRHAECLAAMDYEVRRMIATVPISVMRGKITLTSLLPVEQAGAPLETALRFATKLDMLRADVPTRLSRNALEDPLAEVRAQNLACLSSYYPGAPLTYDALQRGIEDDAPCVRLVAAAGLARVDVISEIGLAPETPPELQLRATDHAMRLAAPEALVRPLIARAFRLGNGAAAARSVRTTAYRLAVPILFELAREADAPRAEILEAIGVVGDERHTGDLIRFLDGDARDVVHATMFALGRIGTIEAVEPLLRIAESILRDAATRAAAREVIARIQERAGNREAGRLSIAADDGARGQVALADGRGAISTADGSE